MSYQQLTKFVARTSPGKYHSPQPRPSRKEIEDDFLDRWSPKTDHGHYQRAQLYRERKGVVARHQRKTTHRRADYLRAQRDSSEDTESQTKRPWLRPSFPSSSRPHSRSSSRPSSQSSSRPNSSASSVTYPSTRSSTPHTPLTPKTDLFPAAAPSVVVSDLSSTFQDELDSYDSQIKGLQQDQWPSVPSARSPALRLKGSAFSQKTASDVKQWAFVEGMLYGGHSATLRDSDTVRPSTAYKAGTIFSAPFHSSGIRDERWVSVNDPHQTATPFGVVVSKYRKMIVVKTFGEHCVCVPIFTFSGRGLAGKEKSILEYVSIRDVSDRDSEPAEGAYVQLLAAADPGFCGRIVKGKSSVKLTQFCSHHYDAPATIEGELGNLSTVRLLNLVKVIGDVPVRFLGESEVGPDDF
ncbi:hypothetical protein F4777DRAFT_319340 [Nemania sp. FL0916]|nr:hypothetical protein F4777DRAFT_319340 [Nemania sp. FL0916]